MTLRKKTEKMDFFSILFVACVLIVIALILIFTLTTTTTTTPANNGILITDQLDSTVQLINNGLKTMQISLQLDPNDTASLWTIQSGDGSLGDAIYNDLTQNPPDYQLVTLLKNQYLVLNIPSSTLAWRITPLSTTQGGMPILIECAKDVVCDMSAVDGVNYLCKMELTATPNRAATTIDFNTSPCSVSGQGCLNPYVNGLFADGVTWESEPCHAGTCNLIGTSREYCQLVNTNQCSNVNSTYLPDTITEACKETADHPQLYTTYCYSHSDQMSSPTLVSPYKLKAAYTDL